MKNLILSICLLLGSLIIYTQDVYAQDIAPDFIENEARSGEIYIFFSDATIQGYDLKHGVTYEKFKVAQAGDKCRVIEIKRGERPQYVLKFGNFTYKEKTTTRSLEDKQNDFLCDADNGSYFVISVSEFHTKANPYPKMNNFIFGALLAPIKIRLGNKEERLFDFTTDVAIGTSVGLRMGISEFQPQYINFLLSVGISSVYADEESLAGILTDQANLAALTLSGGVLFEISDMQVGLFAGADWLSKEAGRAWGNQGQLWFSIGIGYQIFSKNLSNGKGSLENKRK